MVIKLITCHNSSCVEVKSWSFTEEFRSLVEYMASMKAPVLLLLVLIPVRPHNIVEEPMSDDLYLEWLSYQKTFNKTYSSHDEAAMRRRIWEENVAEIVQHNTEAAAGKHSYTLGVNDYTDMTSKEFMSIFSHPTPFRPLIANVTSDRDPDFEEALDLDDGKNDYLNWAELGAVSPVKDQGHCGSCWAFSTIGAVEGRNAIKYGEHWILSEQELLDCCWPECEGCGGCNTETAFACSVRLGGLVGSGYYPYVAKDKACRLKPGRVLVKIRDYITHFGEENLYKVVRYKGPASVGFTMTHKFIHYKSGIFTDRLCSSFEPNHAMLVVGYTKKYWIAKNSFGTNWGEDGFVKVLRGSKGPGMCSIASEIVIPVLG